jgi:hypothetical protein
LKLEILKEMVSFIEDLTNNCNFDKAIKLIKYIEEESVCSIIDCFEVIKLYVIKEQWDKVKLMNVAYN